MDKHDELIKELNKFLRGVHMGADTFRVYQDKAENKELKSELTKSMVIFREQDEKVSSYIKELGGEPTTSLGVAGEMASMFEKLKDMFIDNDKELIKHTINAIDMGIEGGNNLLHSYKDEHLDKSIFQHLNEMVSQYKVMKNKFEIMYKSL
ncbi:MULTISPECIES: DUF2383 domain-containing protein [Paraclostridium]|uniref:DUF2383 domain-containing protein n=1 Tax=Paraclostridium TaxID=1849822 RepID=UPI00038D128C|nr:DUF2383 domain-containing protein [Paraclostridium bifermentans]EQK47908.1 hypothetical protein C671_0605 [[Clostridium] bifermentans ATCC 19299] [Paraclostridium bifermentans ATCC 19299]MDV8116042.1 DUF2383 domain-containing protein [Bacillus sp. BAU-SS-2023]TQO56016.1 DUF2383 domain-containing protein [Paraclostridium bifermentans]